MGSIVEAKRPEEITYLLVIYLALLKSYIGPVDGYLYSNPFVYRHYP